MEFLLFSENSGLELLWALAVILLAAYAHGVLGLGIRVGRHATFGFQSEFPIRNDFDCACVVFLSARMTFLAAKRKRLFWVSGQCQSS